MNAVTSFARSAAALLMCMLAGAPAPAAGEPPRAAPPPSGFRPELVLQTPHSGKVSAVAVSPDGRWTATGGSDSTVKIWSPDGAVLRTLAGHQNPVTAVAISPDGRVIASASWDTPDQQDMMQAAMQRGGRGGADAAGGGGGALKLWDAATGRELRSVDLAPPDGAFNPAAMMAMAVGGGAAQGSVAFSPDGRTVSVANGASLLVLDVASGREVRSFGADGKDASEVVALSADGRWLVTGGTKTGGGSRFRGMVGIPGMGGAKVEYKLTLWDIASGKEVRTATLPEAYARMGSAISGDGRTLAIGAAERSDSDTSGVRMAVRLVDLQSGKELRRIDLGAGAVARSMSFSADGSKLAIDSLGMAGAQVRVFDVASGTQARTITTGAAVTMLDAGASAFSPDGRTLAATSGGTVRMFDVATGAETTPARSSTPTAADYRRMAQSAVAGSASSLAFSPDGRWLAAGGLADVHVWDLAGGTRVRNQAGAVGMGPVAFDRNGGWLAMRTIGPDGSPTIRLVEPGTWRELRTVAPDEGGSAAGMLPGALAISPDGRFAAGGGSYKGYSGGVLGRPKIEYTPFRITDLGTGRVVRSLEVKGDDAELLGGGGGLSVTFSPDGRLMATGGGVTYDVKAGKMAMFGLGGGVKVQLKDMNVRVTEVATGREVRTVKGGGAKAFSPDGRAMALTTLAGQDRYAISVIDLASGAPLASIDAGSEPPGFIAFSPDGSRVGSTNTAPAGTGRFFAAYDHTVRVWDARSGRELMKLPHSVGVEAFAFSPDGKLVATESQDGNTLLWDGATGELLATLVQPDGPNDWLVVTPDGLFDGTAAAWQQIQWRFSESTFDVGPVELFFSEYYHPGLLADVLSGARPKATRDIASIDRRQPQVSLAVAGAGGGPVGSRTVGVTVEVAEAPGAGARDVRLFRNGSLVKVWRGEVAGGRGVFEAAVPVVAGENRFTAYAFNRDNVKSRDASALVTGAESLRRKGVAYVLAVGVNSYENAQYDLKYAAADARAFGEAVRAEQARVGEFERVEVVELLDRDATKANVLAALARLAGDAAAPPAGAPASLQALAAAQPEDAVIVYFAGHGTAQQSRFYLIPHDLGYAGPRTALDAPGLEAILAHSVSDQELERALEGIGAARLMLVIDACNSGQALEAEERRRGPMNSRGLAQLAYEKGMYILAAAQGYQAALEAAQLGHGYLTYALVEEGLKTKAADSEPSDGEIVAREWLDFATRRVPEMQEARDLEARKLVHGDAAKPAPTVDATVKDVQRPRVFYRRDEDSRPLVVAKPSQ